MAIAYRRLGRHGVLVSNLCLGTMNFGNQTSEKDAFAIMDRALELGINFFDTADVYGWTPRGLTEEIIGPLARAGRRAPGGDRAGHQGLQPRRPRGRKAGAQPQRQQPLGGEDPPPLRRQPPPAAHRDASTSTRCTTSTGTAPGRRSGRPWTPSSARAR